MIYFDGYFLTYFKNIPFSIYFNKMREKNNLLVAILFFYIIINYTNKKRHGLTH